MDTPFTIRDQACPNEACAYYNLKARGNLVIHGKIPPRTKCTSCGKTWVAYRNEIHYGLRTNSETILHALALLSHGVSVRKTAEQIQVSPTTIQRWKYKAIKSPLTSATA